MTWFILSLAWLTLTVRVSSAKYKTTDYGKRYLIVLFSWDTIISEGRLFVQAYSLCCDSECPLWRILTDQFDYADARIPIVDVPPN